MERRSLLRGLAAAGAVWSGGCIGGGGEIVTSVRRRMSVEPGDYWAEQIPADLDHGGAIQYVSRADRPYDVYFFTSDSQMEAYKRFLEGDRPADMPAGDTAIGRTATPADGDADMYTATTRDDGARQSIDTTGPHFFVLDNSNYPTAGGAYLGERAKSREIYLDLTVTKKRFGLPF